MSRWLLRGCLTALALGFCLPLLALVLHAFTQRWFYPDLLPAEWTAAPLLRLVSAPQTRAALLQSLLIAGLTTALALLLGYPAGRALGLGLVPRAELIALLLVLPTVVPPLAIGMGLATLALVTGLSGTLAGVVLAHLIPTLPYVVLTLAGSFARYDLGYEQQAANLGAGRWRILWRVTLPLLAPSLAAAALFAFLISWSQYLLTLLIGGGRVITLPVLLFAAVAGGNPTSLAGLALITVLPPALAITAAWRLLRADAQPERLAQL